MTTGHQTIGLPAANLFVPDVLQGGNYTCTIKCSQLILNSHDIPVSEKQLVDYATTHGLYSPPYRTTGLNAHEVPGGTPHEHVGRLMEVHHIPIKRYDHATLGDIKNELSQGHQLLIGVDSGELYAKGFFARLFERIEDLLLPGRADHSILLCGLELDASNSITAFIITDVGTGAYCLRYDNPERFLDAFKDSGFRVIATTAPAPKPLLPPEAFNRPKVHSMNVSFKGLEKNFPENVADTTSPVYYSITENHAAGQIGTSSLDFTQSSVLQSGKYATPDEIVCNTTSNENPAIISPNDQYLSEFNLAQDFPEHDFAASSTFTDIPSFPFDSGDNTPLGFISFDDTSASSMSDMDTFDSENSGEFATNPDFFPEIPSEPAFPVDISAETIEPFDLDIPV